MPVAKDTARELIERLQAGDLSAQEELWERYGENLRRRARTRLAMLGLRFSHESLDICHSVWINICERAKENKLGDIETLGGYLNVAVENKAKDMVRRMLAQRRDERRREARPVEEYNLAAHEDSVGEVLFQQECREIVRSRLGDDWPIYELRAEGYKWATIAERLGGNADQLRIRFTRAIERIRADLNLEVA